MEMNTLQTFHSYSGLPSQSTMAMIEQQWHQRKMKRRKIFNQCWIMLLWAQSLSLWNPVVTIWMLIFSTKTMTNMFHHSSFDRKKHQSIGMLIIISIMMDGLFISPTVMANSHQYLLGAKQYEFHQQQQLPCK